MRSQKGVTMIGLIVYVASFLLIASVIGGVTSFFYGNSKLMSQEIYSSADFNKLNLYFIRESEIEGNRFKSISENPDDKIYSVEFSNGDIFTCDLDNKNLYYNNICICQDVQSFEVKELKDPSYGKQVLSVKVNFTNRSYTTKYTMAQ